MSIRSTVPRSSRPRGASLRSPAVLTAVAMAALILSPAARAADLPTKAPAARPYDWGGCYAGLNAGAGAGGTSFTTTVGNGTYLTGTDPGTVGGIGTGSANATAFAGGGQIGCNWQTGTFVFGLEGDLDAFHDNPQFINATGTLTNANTFGVIQSVKTDVFATVRPRVGIAADRSLAYLTGGAAFSHASYTQSYTDGNAPAGTGSATGAKSLVGFAVGAGWEYAWTDHWTFKLEYLFARFPTTNGLGTIAAPGAGTNPLQGSADLTVQTLRAGVNFKF